MTIQEFRERLAELQNTYKKNAEKLQESFKKGLGKLNNVQDFAKLLYFELTLPESGFYSLGFEILGDESIRNDSVKNWVRNSGKAKKDTKDFFDRLLPFAGANGTGSFYCIWVDDDSKPLDQLPIVVFGDEGGVHVVAENFKQLLHLLTFDEEISVGFDSVYFYKDENDYEESEYLQNYLVWLKNWYNLDPVTGREETEKIIKTAQDMYGEKFNAWFSQYYRK